MKGKLIGSMTSIVVFSDDCELRKIPENSRNSVVIQLHDLLNLIVFLLQKREKIWTIEEVDSLYDCLSSLPKPTQEVKDKHIQDAKFAKFENLK